ncbi:MAG: copper amine oxidase N-terminal domain-containing protein [Oscillospiraceae bacterium]|nr:copper amine oxidase N-terminal domain-containing protein [Oscillospiraceae bacterium]
MKKVLSLALAFALGLSLASGMALAKKGWVNLSAEYADIKIDINSINLIPKDVNGKIVEPFIIDGTTYVPIRAISEAYDKTVTWHGDEKRIQIYDNWESSWPIDKIKEAYKNKLIEDGLENVTVLKVEKVMGFEADLYLIEFSATFPNGLLTEGIAPGEFATTDFFVRFEKDINGNPKFVSGGTGP